MVDDNSPDDTKSVVIQMQNLFGSKKIKLHSRPGKLGLGTALKEGCELCLGEYIITMDADFSHHVIENLI